MMQLHTCQRQHIYRNYYLIDLLVSEYDTKRQSRSPLRVAQHTLLQHLGDSRLVVTDLEQHLPGVLAERGWHPAQLPRLRIEDDWIRHRLQVVVGIAPVVQGETTRSRLRVLQQLLQCL